MVNGQTPWTYEQGTLLEDMRRDIQRLKQEHQAVLEVHQQELLACKDEIRSLHTWMAEMQQSMASIMSPSGIPLSETSRSESCQRLELTKSDSSHALSTSSEHGKRRRVEVETTRFKHAPQIEKQRPQAFGKMATVHCDIRRSIHDHLPMLVSLPNYTYEPLPENKNIRLLELLKGPFFAPLECRLLITSLNVEQSYQALSYVWGDTMKTHSITIDGKLLSISTNLDRALRKVRQIDQDVCLWVDAICINQEDTAEKSHQVSRMFQIYQAAQCVIVYLGEQADHSELLPEFFDMTVRTCHLYQCIDNRDINNDHEDLRRSISILEEIGDSTSNNVMWRAARAFYARPWISRVWIVQEIVAAKELLFLCGGWKLSGHILNRSVFASVRWPQLCPFGDIFSGSSKGLIQFFKTMNARSTGMAGVTELLDLFYLSRGCKSTDLRDHVFAILSMARQDTQPPLVTNYHEDWRHTYLRCAEHLISQGLVLRTLYLSSADWASPYKQTGELPSWVPDFSFEGEAIWLANDHGEVHGETTAGGNGTISPRIIQELRILTIQAFELDSIHSFSFDQIQQPALSDDHARVLQWRTELEELWPSSRRSIAEEMQDTICRVMLGEQEPPDLEIVRPLIWSMDPTELNIDADATRVLRDLIRFCSPRRRCITSTGFLGHVPLLAREGDVIVVPTGSAVPFILRPCQTQYQLIGQAYIHGVMMGEALEFEDLIEEEFELI